MLLTTLSLGLLTTIVAEIVTWINKKISGTVLKGDGAWLLAAVVSIIAASFKVLHSGLPTNWVEFSTQVASIWSISQVFFLWVVQKFNLDVQPAQG